MMDGVIREIQKDENQKKLKVVILDPAAKYIENCLKPYFFTLLIVLLLMIAILIWMLKIVLCLKKLDASI